MKTSPSSEPLELPFFVYGTLRRGESNHFHFNGVLVSATDAMLYGAQLWNLGPYPMAVIGEGTVSGELFEIDSASYERVLHALDRLEGVNLRQPEKPGGLYHRARQQVRAGDTAIEAWVYFGREDLARRGKIISHGDWKNRKFAGESP